MKLNSIVKRYILNNKKNTLLIIISIILSTALFLVMNIISEDARNIVIDQAKKELGTKHCSYHSPTNEEVEDIKKHKSIDEVGIDMLLGLSDIGNSQTLQILYDDETSMKINEAYILKDGKMPIKENEIVLDTWYIKQKKIKDPIGKAVKLEYTRYSSDGSKILYKGKKEFNIVGILQSNPLLKSQGMSIGVISEECAIKNIPLKNKYDQVMFTFKKERNIEKQTKNLVKDCNLDNDNIRLNNVIIKAISDSISLKIPYIIINIVLAFATILLIYNVFYILVCNRTKDFGILKSLGFTPFNVCQIMILEVFLYSIISIPIGLMLGYIISNLCRDSIIGIIYNVNYANNMTNNNYILTYLLTILLSTITIIISILKPINMCYKIDPMIVMRRSEEKVDVNKKSIVSKIMTKLFGDYGNTASKNIQRNKKRTSLMILSMAIVLFLISTVYTKSTSNFLNDGGLRWWIPGEYLMHNITFYSANDNKMAYNKNTLQDIKNIEGVKDVNASRAKRFDIDININKIDKESKYWKNSKKRLEDNAEATKYNEGKKAYRAAFEVMGIEENSMVEDFIIEGKDKLNQINDNPYIYIDKNSSKSLNIKTGDKVKVVFAIVDEKTNEYKETILKDFIVAGIIKFLPLTSQGAGSEFGAVMSVNQMNKFTGFDTYERFDIYTSKLANGNYIEGELNKILEKTGKGILIPYKSESAGIEKSDNQKTMIMILVILVIVILSLFNVLNTIVTSINSRSREFALFRGIGISKEEIKKIIKLEGLLYIFISFIISIVPILIVRNIIIKDFENIALINIKFIIATILILSSLIFMIMVTSTSVLKKVQDDNFIELIKTLE